ncbi:hypothetical protein [Paraliomyxa miuraensis]|uniref:hypothetical protein n=1 Tax=Paraliomyxa miuraensis TaxID=376150 RepID=UPI00224EED86|nr:hypothetical protein [Paraliomyxa miuraensis]MCX4244665.1 hypothetical protein [Paraliomyxa miuraensis]
MLVWFAVLVGASTTASTSAHAAGPLSSRAALLPRGVPHDEAEPASRRLVPASRPPAPDALVLGAPSDGPWGAAFSAGRPTPSDGESEPPTLHAIDEPGVPALEPPLGSVPPASDATSWAEAFGPRRIAAAREALAEPTLMMGSPSLSFGAVALPSTTLRWAPEAGPESTSDGEAGAAVRTEPGASSASISADGRLDAPELLEKRGLPPFWIDREYATHRTRAIAFPPLFIHRTPKPDHPETYFHADLAFDFGWYSPTTERRHFLNPVALTYGYQSERKTVWGSVPLLMGYRRVGEQFNFGQFPLVWWWGTKFVKNVLVIPFHYQQRAPESFRGVSGLLAWYGHKNLHDADLTNDRRFLVVAPVFWRFQRGLRRFDISPLYFGGANELQGKRHMTVLPLFHWQSREFGNHRELWTLPWIRRVDEARSQQAWAVPPLLTFSHREREREIFSATPLLWRTRNHLRGSELWLAGPFGRYTDPTQRNMALAPVWWRFHDTRTDQTTQVIAPLALTRRGPGELRVYTLLGGGGRTPQGYRLAIPPLLTFAGRTDRGVRYQGVGGLLWHVAQPQDDDGTGGREDWVAGPLAYYSRVGGHDGGSTRRVGVPLALSFFQWGGTRRYQMLTPLLWHVHDTDPAHAGHTVVAGPLYHHGRSGPKGHQFDGGIAPFVFWGRGVERNYGIVPWLALADFTDVAEGRRLTVSPVFVRSKGPDHRTLGIAGLAWDVTRGASERHTVVFPFVYRRALGDDRLTLSLVGGRRVVGDDVTAMWGPYVERRRDGQHTRGVFPLVFVDERATEGGVARHVVAAPLYLRRRAPVDDLDMWSPLIWRSEVRGERPRRGLAVVPFYFRQRQPGGVDVDAGLGFFWSRDETRRTHTLVAGPAFHRLSRKSINTGVFPLYWWMDSEDKRRLLALPLTVHIEDKAHRGHTTIAVPLWFDRLQVNGRRTWGAFPFVFGNRRIASFTRFSVAPPGYFDLFRLRRNMRFTGYVPLLFRYRKCGYRVEDDPSCQYTLWGSVPLFLYGRDGQGRRTHGALVYYWDRRPEGYRLYTPLFGLTNEPGKTLGWYAGPVGMRTTNTWQRTFAFPLYYRRSHRLERRSLTLAAPPLFISRVRKDERFFEAGLLVWQFRKPHKVATAIVPPIFFHSHAWAERRVTWLLPLFVRDDHWAKDEAFTGIGPLLYFQRRHGENLDFVQFPLVWHIERGDAQGTFGAFAWWDIRTRKGKMLQFVPGLFTRWATPERDIKVLGPGLGWWTKGRGATEGDLHWRALFGLFGGGREHGMRYVSFFGTRRVTGPAKVRAPRGRKADPSSGPAPKAKREARRAERRARRQARTKARTATAAAR